ncbi:MAG: glycosyltransferase [bacterium]
MMSNKKILILGYFGYEENQLDGQTIKTRNIYNLFSLKQQQEKFYLSSFDTQSFQKNKLNIFKMFSAIIKSNTLIYIAAHNNLKYLFPIIFVTSRLFHVKIHYMVVGGWLADFIKTKQLHIRFLNKIEGIYPETKDLYHRLKNEYDFQNIYQLHNFRIINKNKISKTLKKTDKNHIKLVFMARVQPMKGVEVLFSLAEKLKYEKIKNVTIDIYGPILNEYNQIFKQKLKKHKIIDYKGILLPDDIHYTLKNYDLMLFPTQFYTEGFPGSILDAYISGIPVIATSWKYANEFIENYVSGIIVEFNNPNAFIKETIQILKNPNEIDRMKKCAIKQYEKYNFEKAWMILKNRLI